MKDIIAFGLGQRFRHDYDTASKIFNIIAIADNDLLKQGKIFTTEDGNRIPVIAPSQIKDYAYDGIMVSVWNGINEIHVQLHKLGVSDSAIFNLNMWKELENGGGGVPLLVAIIGQACSLRCRDCANFAPYAAKDRLFYDTDAVISDIAAVVEAGGYVQELQIQGGEPFLHKGLKDILRYAIEESRIHHICLATNGTIIPDEQTISLLRDAKVLVRISRYPSVSHREVMSDICRENGIAFKIYTFDGGIGVWRKCGGRSMTRSDDIETEATFLMCDFKNCFTVENHIIGWCSRSTHAPFVQDMQFHEEDYLTIRDGCLSKDELAAYVKQHRAMECCHYCYGTIGDMVEPGVQLT